MSFLILRRHSSFTSSSAPKNSFPCFAAWAMYLSTLMPIRTLALLMWSKKGRKEKYPDARRNPTTASRFLMCLLCCNIPSNSFMRVLSFLFVKKLVFVAGVIFVVSFICDSK